VLSARAAGCVGTVADMPAAADSTDPDKLLTRAEAAAVLRVRPATLARWAARGIGPSYSRSGTRRGRCLYAVEDVRRWVESRRIPPRPPR